jgi:hypothetical protein
MVPSVVLVLGEFSVLFPPILSYLIVKLDPATIRRMSQDCS